MSAPPDLDALERAARAATPGPWLYGPLEGANATWEISLAPEGKGAALVAEVFSEDDRDFIAAVDPPTVLALIARLRAAEAREREAWIDEATEDAATDRALATYDAARGVWRTAPYTEMDRRPMRAVLNAVLTPPEGSAG